MKGDDFAYLEVRAEEELECAQKALDSRAVKAHYELAEAYLGRIYGEDPASA